MSSHILKLRYVTLFFCVYNLSITHQTCDNEISSVTAIVVLENLKDTRKCLSCCYHWSFQFASESWRALRIHLPRWPGAWLRLWNQCRTTSRGTEKLFPPFLLTRSHYQQPLGEICGSCIKSTRPLFTFDTSSLGLKEQIQ